MDDAAPPIRQGRCCPPRASESGANAALKPSLHSAETIRGGRVSPLAAGWGTQPRFLPADGAYCLQRACGISGSRSSSCCAPNMRPSAVASSVDVTACPGPARSQARETAKGSPGWTAPFLFDIAYQDTIANKSGQAGSQDHGCLLVVPVFALPRHGTDGARNGTFLKPATAQATDTPVGNQGRKTCPLINAAHSTPILKTHRRAGSQDHGHMSAVSVPPLLEADGWQRVASLEAAFAAESVPHDNAPRRAMSAARCEKGGPTWGQLTVLRRWLSFQLRPCPTTRGAPRPPSSLSHAFPASRRFEEAEFREP